MIQPDVYHMPNSINPTNTEGKEHLENRFKIIRVAVFWRACGKQRRKSEEWSMKKGNLVKPFNS